MESTETSPGVEITRYLQQWRAGEQGALDRLSEAIHKELRKLSRAILGPHRPDFLLQPTVLLHELYAKLPAIRDTDWQSRAQFFNTAARIMRNIAVDHARNCRAMKRAGGAITLPPALGARDYALRIDVLMVNDALDQFAQEYPRQARGVKLRFFRRSDSRGDSGNIMRRRLRVFRSNGGTGLAVRQSLAAELH